MSVSTPAAVGTGSALALGPQALAPAVQWGAKCIASNAWLVPSEAETLSVSAVLIFLGGGVIWMLVTLVRWFFKKHHIIEENGNAPLMPVINP